LLFLSRQNGLGGLLGRSLSFPSLPFPLALQTGRRRPSLTHGLDEHRGAVACFAVGQRGNLLGCCLFPVLLNEPGRYVWGNAFLNQLNNNIAAALDRGRLLGRGLGDGLCLLLRLCVFA
jgi:hypothetical protein